MDSAKVLNPKQRLIVHPFLFALFPALHLFSSNPGQVIPAEIAGPSAVILVSTAVVWLLTGLCVRDMKKAAILTSLFLILFFSFGPARKVTSLAQETLLAAGGGLFVLASVVLARTKINLAVATRVLNAVAGILIFAQFFTIGLNDRGFRRERSGLPAAKSPHPSDAQVPEAARPDIYYLILDSYARQSTLKDVYGFDNGEFLGYLKKQGFYVAAQSSSNYPVTVFSLASSLNLDYLSQPENLIDVLQFEEHLRTEELKDNETIRFLKSRGYAIITFATAPGVICDHNADLCFKPLEGLGEFQGALLRMTPIVYWTETFPLFKKVWGKLTAGKKGYSPSERHRQGILFAFDHLDRVFKGDRPVFVFAHMLCPHPPFVFDREGRPVNEDLDFSTTDGCDLKGDRRLSVAEYRKEYTDQLSFMNQMVERTLGRLLARRGKNPRVIIVQSDHGPRSTGDWDNLDTINFKERMNILNAYYFSDGDYGALDETISPVNSFRVVFNKYFGQTYARLPDRSYFVSGPYRKILTDVSDRR